MKNKKIRQRIKKKYKIQNEIKKYRPCCQKRKSNSSVSLSYNRLWTVNMVQQPG